MRRHNQLRAKKSTVVFDGDCGFCSAGVAMLARVDGGRNFKFLSLHDPQVKALLPDREHADLMREMHIVDLDGRWYAGAEAVRMISRRTPFLWWAALYLHIPGTLPLWNKLYDAIARRRYRISQRFGCDGDACSVHARGGAS
jgi:predicted DCC family thiol-disulfide oxidoreductase YuxK